MNEKEKQLQQRKTRLITRYMRLQDAADKYNERIYVVCCEIERVNLEIEVERRRAEKAAGPNGAAVAAKPRSSKTA